MSGTQATTSTQAPTSTPTATPSPNDTIVSGTSSSIIDSAGNKWTITAGGQVAVNGVADATTKGVIELAYVSGTIWQENSSRLWWGETEPNASWAPSAGTPTSPLPATPTPTPVPTPTPSPTPTPTPAPTPTPTPSPTPSPNDTVVNGTAGTIIDASGNQWTIIAGGQVEINGVADATTKGVIELAYVNGIIWQENSSELWWGETEPNASWAPSAGTPTSPLPATPTPMPVPTPTPTPTLNELTPTSGSTLTDAAGNKWTLTSAGVVDENGTAVPGSSGTSAFAIVSGVDYGQDATSQSWFTYSPTSQSWTSSAAPVLTPSPTPTPAPGGPAGISNAQDLINYFTQLQGKGIVSGEFIETGDPASATIDPLTTLASQTGQNLGLIGIDYWHDGGSGPAITADANADAIAQWKAGGLVELGPDIPNPTTGGGSFDTSNLDAAGLLTPGTATNNALNASLSQVAAGLQQLQNAGVVVLFRPFLESNGNWFWWGAGNLSASQFQALWQYTYNYMTNTMGLHNLVWVYAINAGFALPGRTLTDTYPGSAYVNITGQDLYTDNPGADGTATYQALLALGKPTALAEFGSGGPSNGDPSFSLPTLISQVQADMPKTVYWLNWWNQNSGGNGWGMEADQNTSAALNDGYVINRGQIANSSTSPPTPTPTPTPNPPPTPNDTMVLAGATTAITDGSGAKWTITSTGQVALNGVADTTTANVTELVYVNNEVWQENAAGMWYGKTSSAAAWSAGTSTSPLPAPITIASGIVSDTISQSEVSVAATSGGHMLFLSGSGDIVTLAGGANTITDTGSGNTYILPAGGNGSDTFTSNILATGDTLDLKTALAATNWTGSASTLTNYLTVTDSAKTTTLSISSSSGGPGTAIATITGATTATLASLLTHSIT
jgi:hypothetical protein